MQSKALHILRWILVIPTSLGIILLLEWFSTTVLQTQLDSSVRTGIKRIFVILTSSIGSILIAGLIAPSKKFKASCGIAMLWIIAALMATGFALYANSDYELLDGGVSITSIFLGLIIGVLISSRLFQKLKRID